ncbi:Uncharacterised protein [Staphylococcus aureus]|nr:Uncharacterised protein [Staphylococcus aureus]
MAVSCGAPKSSPHSISSKPSDFKNSIASSYEILGNGVATFSSFDVSRSKIFNSSLQFSKTDFTTCVTYCS